MKSVRGTHRYLAESLRFPDYYGGNLDALYDCLCELPGNLRVVLTHSETLRWSLGDYSRRLLNVFEDAAADGAFELELC